MGHGWLGTALHSRIYLVAILDIGHGPHLSLLPDSLPCCSPLGCAILGDSHLHLLLLLQFSLWNFIKYNVFGGGDSALYGVESSSFYLRNGLNNLNLVLPLALAYPIVAMLDLFQVTGTLPLPCYYKLCHSVKDC